MTFDRLTCFVRMTHGCRALQLTALGRVRSSSGMIRLFVEPLLENVLKSCGKPGSTGAEPCVNSCKPRHSCVSECQPCANISA
jgi:hypothetical protein